jgi:hypothetical protein
MHGTLTLFSDETDLIDGVPSAFICPLTMTTMSIPMLTRWGHNFERSAILQWMSKGNECCPLTRRPMTLSDLVRNRPLEEEIRKWKWLHGEGEVTDSETEMNELDDVVVYVAITPEVKEQVSTKRRRLWNRMLRHRANESHS